MKNDKHQTVEKKGVTVILMQEEIQESLVLTEKSNIDDINK